MKKHNVNVQKRKKHYTVGAILWLIVEYVSLIFFGLCAVVPVISCVITAFKTQEEYQAGKIPPERYFNEPLNSRLTQTRYLNYLWEYYHQQLPQLIQKSSDLK